MTPLPHICLAVICVSLAACSAKSDKGASLVAVKVNGDELSVPQMNSQLVRLKDVPESERETARKQVMDGLVDQQLLVQQARELKLDRDPEVLAMMEASKAQILSQAYLQKSIAPKAKPTDDMVTRYYAENPELFEKRRVYRLQELATEWPPERVDELRRVVNAKKSMGDVATWLRDQNIKIAANTAVRGAEMLPLQSLAQISAMKDGEMSVMVTGKQVAVLQVTASQLQPLDAKQARPFIEQYLATIKREELSRADVARLRASAKIEYVGEFVKLAALSSAASAPAAATPARAAASSATSAVDKGLAGLR